MLKESKKLFPHWLDKNENSNFSKHLSILNRQQTDIRHKLKTIEWSRLLNKPLQIHKVQVEPHKWKMEFEVDVKRLKKVNIYKNPTIVNNEVVNTQDVINGYYNEGHFYKFRNKKITNLESSVSEEDKTYNESEIVVSDNYYGLIFGEEGNFYYDLDSEKYYIYENESFIEKNKEDVLPTSLIHSESFIDNYSHFFRHILYEDNTNETIIRKFVTDKYQKEQYKTIIQYPNSAKNGKYELIVSSDSNNPRLYYNVNTKKYCKFNDDGSFDEIEDDKIVYIEGNRIDRVDHFNENGYYYIFTDTRNDLITTRIPLIEIEDITPIISNDKYVLEVYTWDDYHFLKGYPEIDFIDYNNNSISDDNEKNYDNLSITVEKINENDYLTFRVHQFGIKKVEVFKDNKPIHIADFVVEKLGFSTRTINNNFAHIYNYNDNEVYYPFLKDTDSLEEVILDKDEYVWRWKLSDEDKIFDENDEWNYELKNKYDLKVTYYDSLHPNDSEYDKILMKTYVYEDSIFYHDVSLDMIGKIYNVPRYVFRQPKLETYSEQVDFYSNTYPTYCNTLSEDDYHYQNRLIKYINSYNKVYFPVLELWKYFHIDSELVNRKVILSEQNYSYLRTLKADEEKYINELSKNKLESFYLNDEYVYEEEEKNLKKPKLKSIISPDDYLNSREGILVDDDNNFIRDAEGNFVRTDYVYNVDTDESGNKIYTIEYENASRIFNWYKPEKKKSKYQIVLTKSLKIVPSTKYQLRFCVKEYPSKDLNLRVIYKNSSDNAIEVEETTPVRKDYDDTKEFNEIVYTNYKNDWGISCEYICTDFVTSDVAQSIEVILESESNFKISDVTLQRITINHFDSEYMKTSTDYNSCVYDLYADYTKIPNNIRYENVNIFNEILNRSLPLAKTGYFNFIFEENDMSNDMDLNTETNIYIDNLLDVDILSSPDNANVNRKKNGIYSYTYKFDKYIRPGDYEIEIKPFTNNENNVIDDLKMDVKMIVFNNDNTAVEKTITLNCSHEYLKNDGDGNYFRIPFENKSENSLEIKIYRNNKFQFKNFKLNRKSPLTMEEITA